MAIAGSSIGAMPWRAPGSRWNVSRRSGGGLLFPRRCAPSFPWTGLSSGTELERYPRSVCEDMRTEDLRMPFAALATDSDNRGGGG